MARDLPIHRDCRSAALICRIEIYSGELRSPYPSARAVLGSFSLSFPFCLSRVRSCQASTDGNLTDPSRPVWYFWYILAYRLFGNGPNHREAGVIPIEWHTVLFMLVCQPKVMSPQELETACSPFFHLFGISTSFLSINPCLCGDRPRILQLISAPS